MSFTAFSIGRDTQLVVMGPNGRVDLEHVTSFESRQITNPYGSAGLMGAKWGRNCQKVGKAALNWNAETPQLTTSLRQPSSNISTEPVLRLARCIST